MTPIAIWLLNIIKAVLQFFYRLKPTRHTDPVTGEWQPRDPFEITDPRRLSRATAKGHIHNHRPTQHGHGVAMTHAWYRRRGKLPPTRHNPKGWTDLQLTALNLMTRKPR